MKSHKFWAYLAYFCMGMAILTGEHHFGKKKEDK